MPFKSSLVRSAGKLFGIFDQEDLDLRGAVNDSRIPPPPFYSTGGNARTPGNGYTYHVFTEPGIFRVGGLYDPTNTINLLLIAGGGAGGSYYGAGGGAGGVVNYTGITFGNTESDIHNVVIGDGGANTPAATGNGDPGDDSTFSGLPGGTITAKGGGGGSPAGDPPTGVGIPGGSGGGRGSVPGGPDAGGTGVQPTQNPTYSPLTPFNQYGYPGGAYPPTSTGYMPAGGGGAGAAGGDGAQTPGGAIGGVGVQIPWAPGPIIPDMSPLTPHMGPTDQYYAGGGSAGSYSSPSTPQPAAYGGGGQGSAPPASQYSTAGIDWLGGGGGGRHPSTNKDAPITGNSPTAGGKGICIIRITAPS